MIKINGKVFRNLEEQVAYLSEMIPLFEEDNGQLIIKQGDGTEIARITLDAVSNMNVSTVNDITTITITKADSTTQTFTIDMSGYLKKVSSATPNIQAYVKNDDGSQGMINVSQFESDRYSIVMRNEVGCVKCAMPEHDSDATNKNYVDTKYALKADLNNNKQEITAFEITAENMNVADLYQNGANITLDSAYGGISFKPSGSNKYITIGAGQIKGIDTVSNNTDAANKKYVDDNIPHLYEHNITIQISVEGDSESDIYGHLTILNTSATKFTVASLTNYLKDNIDNGADYNKVFTCSGQKVYTGIGYNSGAQLKLMVQAGYSDYEISAIDVYSDCVIQIF